jgi:hypothetical protein
MEAFDSNAYKRYQNFNFYCGQQTKEQMRIVYIRVVLSTQIFDHLTMALLVWSYYG